MAADSQAPGAAPMEVSWRPQGHHPLLPIQVLRRSDLLDRIASGKNLTRERVQFHLLLVCTEGSGRHVVDFEPLQLERGTILRIHPGQVQQYVLDSPVEALMVIWPWDSHSTDPSSHAWYPGSPVATRWQVGESELARIVEWVDEIDQEQQRFDGSKRRIELMRSLLRTLLLRLAIELPTGAEDLQREEATSSVPPAPLPDAYIDFRAVIEERIYERPTVTSLANQIGYSTRTLDRACTKVSGQTAKQVLDDRVALEVRRLLTHSTQPISRIAANLGFDDASNFSKFVKRQLGETPSDIRFEQ